MHNDRHGPRIVLHVNSTCWAKSQELVCDIMLTETTLLILKRFKIKFYRKKRKLPNEEKTKGKQDLPVPANTSRRELSFCLSLLSFGTGWNEAEVTLDVEEVVVVEADPSEPFRDSIHLDCRLAIEIIRPQQKMSTISGRPKPAAMRKIVKDKECFMLSPQIGIASAWNLYSPHPSIGALANKMQITHTQATTASFLFVVALNGYRIGFEMMKNLSNDKVDRE